MLVSLVVLVGAAAAVAGPTDHDGSSGAGASVSVGAAAGCADPPLLGETINNHKEIFQPPANHSVQPAWLATITAWRSSCRAQIRYNDTIYSVPQLKWARTNFVQPQRYRHTIPATARYTANIERNGRFFNRKQCYKAAVSIEIR